MVERKNPFSGYQKDKISTRVSLIRACLANLAKHRTKFMYITDLANIVSKQVSETEGMSFNKSTLLRNSSYKTLLLQYMTDYCGESHAIKKAEIAKLTSSLETENLRREVERLKVYIRTLEKQLDANRRIPEPGTSFFSPSANVRYQQLENDFVLTCKTILLILKYLESFVALDDLGTKIIDLSKMRNNVIVDETVAKPFLSWLSTQT